jgi:hypothetical protein
MLRRLLLIGTLIGATTGAAMAVEAVPAGATTPPTLNGAEGMCQGLYGGLLVQGEGVFYECRLIPTVPQSGFTPAQRQCENQFGGTFFLADPSRYDCIAPILPH